MSDQGFTAIEAGSDPISATFFLVPFAYVVVKHGIIWLCKFIVSQRGPVLEPTDQTNNLTAEPTTSHTGMLEGHTPDNRDEPSSRRADTRTREVDVQVFQRVQVRNKAGRYTRDWALIRIPQP